MDTLFAPRHIREYEVTLQINPDSVEAQKNLMSLRGR